MAPNIKSAEADRLVEALSKLTGESKTQAVVEALRERLGRETREQTRHSLSSDLLAIGKRCADYGRRDTTDHSAMPGFDLLRSPSRDARRPGNGALAVPSVCTVVPDS